MQGDLESAALERGKKFFNLVHLNLSILGLARTVKCGANLQHSPGTNCNGGPGFVLAGGWAIRESLVGARTEGTFTGTFNQGAGIGVIKYTGNGYGAQPE
jgi:hypothetical protein